MDTERKSGWLLGVMTGVLVLVVAFGLVYMNRVAEHFVQVSEERDCDTLRADIEAIEMAPQLTRAGQNVTLARRARYAQIGCTPVLPPPHYKLITPAPSAT
jgi:hypothetical protein